MEAAEEYTSLPPLQMVQIRYFQPLPELVVVPEVEMIQNRDMEETVVPAAAALIQFRAPALEAQEQSVREMMAEAAAEEHLGQLAAAAARERLEHQIHPF